MKYNRDLMVAKEAALIGKEVINDFRRSKLNIFLLLLFISGCSSDAEIDIPDHIASLENLIVIPENAEALHTIELERTAIYGDTDEVIVGQLGAVTVDEQGRVYLADRSQNLIHIYE